MPPVLPVGPGPAAVGEVGLVTRPRPGSRPGRDTNPRGSGPRAARRPGRGSARGRPDGDVDRIAVGGDLRLGDRSGHGRTEGREDRATRPAQVITHDVRPDGHPLQRLGVDLDAQPRAGQGAGPAAVAEGDVARSGCRRGCGGRRSLRRNGGPGRCDARWRPAAESRAVSPGWQPSWTPRPARRARPMIRRDGMIPPHFESRTLNRSAVRPLDRPDGVGIAAERLVEHDRDAEPRAKVGQGVDLGVADGLLQDRRAEAEQGPDPLDQALGRPGLVGVEPDVHPPAEDRPQAGQPRRVVLAGDPDLELGLPEPIEPHLPRRDRFLPGPLGRDGPAVADPRRPGFRVDTRSLDPAQPRRTTSRTAGRRRRAGPVPARIARRCRPCRAGRPRSPAGGAHRSAGRRRRSRRGGRWRGPTSNRPRASKVVSIVSPVT